MSHSWVISSPRPRRERGPELQPGLLCPWGQRPWAPREQTEAEGPGEGKPLPLLLDLLKAELQVGPG